MISDTDWFETNIWWLKFIGFWENIATAIEEREEREFDPPLPERIANGEIASQHFICSTNTKNAYHQKNNQIFDVSGKLLNIVVSAVRVDGNYIVSVQDLHEGRIIAVNVVTSSDKEVALNLHRIKIFDPNCKIEVNRFKA